jgi:hypothetical protein
MQRSDCITRLKYFHTGSNCSAISGAGGGGGFRILCKISVVSVKDSDATRHFKLNEDLKLSTYPVTNYHMHV